jgi:hypothetical protein
MTYLRFSKMRPERSRKFHPSGLDLTHFEKTVLRRVIPFYSWIRKSSPVLLEGMVMRPGVALLPSKANEAIQMAKWNRYYKREPLPCRPDVSAMA